jgi:hypothetical protein
MPNDLFIQSQMQLQSQVEAMDQLEKEFLAFVWSDRTINGDEYEERLDRLISFLDTSQGLNPHVVMHLFAKLEQKAIREIIKTVTLAQTLELDAFIKKHPELPRMLIDNTAVIHHLAYKSGQSKQTSEAGSGKRKPHPKKKEENINCGKYVHGRRGDKAKFINTVLHKYPEIKRQATVHDWLGEYFAPPNN